MMGGVGLENFGGDRPALRQGSWERSSTSILCEDLARERSAHYPFPKGNGLA